MLPNPEDSARTIEEFASLHELEIPEISKAEKETRAVLSRLAPLVEDASAQDVSVVAFGSLARREMTTKSDVDWTLMIDGPADPAHFEAALEIDNRLSRNGFKEPGQEGTFGGLANSHDLIHKIGGEDDTNRNTTQRILLLLESLPIGGREAYDRVVRNVLKRYIFDDWGLAHNRGPATVPRFLQNDISRYWRTVAVDFAYKRRDRGGKGWALRTVKLRLSRKMTYAAGLLTCFSTELEQLTEESMAADDLPEAIVSHLVDRFSLPPLDIIATTALERPTIAEASRSLFVAYDEFLKLLDDEEKRDHLKELPPGESANDDVYEEARAISHRFQESLDRIFFDDDEDIAELTRTYGVF